MVDELIAYAWAHNVGIVVIGHPTHSRWEEFLHGSVTNDLLRKMPGVDSHIIAQRDRVRREERLGRQDRLAPTCRPRAVPLARPVVLQPLGGGLSRARALATAPAVTGAPDGMSWGRV